MRDSHSNHKVVQTLDPVNVTATTNCAGADRQGFESVDHVINVGESGDTLNGTNYWTLIIEESDDNSTFTAVTAAADVLVGSNSRVSAPNGSGVFATIDDAAEDDAVYRIGYRGGKRYSRVTITENGTLNTGTPMAASAILGHAEQAPTLDD